ncbi:MAG: FAD-binding oxidoreductase [Calothrix sp. SM1_5_4]|nr:FAD-binding oxidoreductase [Calothrix sp. SM1_5_4]
MSNGETLDTGFGHFANAKASHAYRNGVGPSGRPFFQANYGIVTEMGIWLMPRPEDYNAFFFSADSAQALGEILEILGPLKRQGLLPSAIHIANDLRMLANQTRYPFAKAAGRFPLPPELRTELRREFGVGAWTGCGSITGTRQTVRALRDRLKRDLKSFRPIFLDDRKMELLGRAERFLSWFGAGDRIRQNLNKVRPIFDLLKGVPTPLTVGGGNWRVRGEDTPHTTDPLDSHAGLIWVSPVLPMTARAADEVSRILEGIYSQHGFDTLLTFTMITDRALCCVSNIAYDRRDQIETARAKACYQKLYATLIQSGYIPYRSGPTGYSLLADQSSTFWDTAAKIKLALDPESIFSPGRYIRSSPTRKAA